MTRLSYVMAVLNLAADTLLEEGYTLAEIIDGLKAYTKAAERAEKNKERAN